MNKITAFNRGYLNFFLIIFFIMLCYHYSHCLNLWGDESTSLDIAALSLKENLKIADVHAPTYCILLKCITFITGNNYQSEILIRMVHVLFFSIGLYYAYRIMSNFFDETCRDRLTLYTMLLSVTLPSYIFYATNIRMYAILFFLSMWFMFSVITYLKQDSSFKIKDNWNIILSGVLLAGIDYAGLIYYTLGSVFLVTKSLQIKDRHLWSILLAPYVIIFIYLMPIIIPSIKHILAWSHNAVPHLTNHDTVASSLIKTVFNVSKPLIELTAISVSPIYMPLLWIAISSILMISGGIFLIRQYLISRKLEYLYIFSLSIVWLMTSILDLSLTRVFLTSQLFMLVLIIYGLNELNINRLMQTLIVIFLVGFNLYTDVFPIPHLTSGIPYRAIALDTLKNSEQLKINTIIISGNSLNSESVRRYLLQNNHHNVSIKMLNPNFTGKDIPKEPFLFLSYMNENNLFIDATTFHRKLVIMNQYVNLDQLKFNTLWKNNTISRSNQPYAYILYMVI